MQMALKHVLSVMRPNWAASSPSAPRLPPTTWTQMGADKRAMHE